MPNLDPSDITRKLAIAVEEKANAAASKRKFRGTTKDGSAKPFKNISKNISFDDGYKEKKHYAFTAGGGGGISKAPVKGGAGGSGGSSTAVRPSVSITIPEGFCDGGAPITFTGGMTYTVINNTDSTSFLDSNEIVFSFPLGTSTFFTSKNVTIIGCSAPEDVGPGTR
jgi:hypothetical protein